jgi:hypothetical protein
MIRQVFWRDLMVRFLVYGDRSLEVLANGGDLNSETTGDMSVSGQQAGNRGGIVAHSAGQQVSHVIYSDRR